MLHFLQEALQKVWSLTPSTIGGALSTSKSSRSDFLFYGTLRSLTCLTQTLAVLSLFISP